MYIIWFIKLNWLAVILTAVINTAWCTEAQSWTVKERDPQKTHPAWAQEASLNTCTQRLRWLLKSQILWKTVVHLALGSETSLTVLKSCHLYSPVCLESLVLRELKMPRIWSWCCISWVRGDAHCSKEERKELFLCPQRLKGLRPI